MSLNRYFGKGETIVLALWIYNVPGLVVGLAIWGLWELFT